MNNGASRPPAVTGSITSDNSGMPTMAKPPPNAPFMKAIKNTPANATRIVAIVNSIESPSAAEARSGATGRIHLDNFSVHSKCCVIDGTVLHEQAIVTKIRQEFHRDSPSLK